MRIIGGKFGRLRFYPNTKKWPTRPTTDIAKEGLFNILENRLDFENVRMLDLFGGTGNHCFEAISRGCKHCTYVEKFYPCIKFVKKLSGELKIEEQITILRTDVYKVLNKNTIGSFNYIFAGPPYGLKWLDEIPILIEKSKLLDKQAWFVLEHNQHHNFEASNGFKFVKQYGDTIFSFFQHE